MPNQINPSPGIQSSNNLVPQDPSQADPGVVKVMQAIKNVETPGHKDAYNAVGDNGDSHGAYQFNKDNYKNWATQYGVDPNDFSPAAQNKVAYARIADLKNQGLQPEEIAAKWNGAKVDPTTKKLTYVNPEYGVKFRAALTGGSSGGQSEQPQIKAQPESKVADAPTATNDQTQSPDLLNNLIDFAFPIVHDFSGEGAKKTALQKIGDLGLSALWFLPGVGEGAEAAIKGTQLLGETGAKIAGQALGGAATGYGADVASNLSQGKDVSQSLTPGLGTFTGGALGGVLGKLGSKYSQEGVLNDITKSNNDVIGQTKRGATDLAESFSKNKNPGELLAQKGINIADNVNPETVAYDTAHHATGLRQDAKVLNETLTTALDKVPGTTPVSELESTLLSKVPQNYPERADLIKKEMSLLKQQYGENVPAGAINEWKQRAWDFSKFDMAVPNETRKTFRMIGNQLKTTVEGMVDKAKIPGFAGKDVANFNEYVGQHLDAADFLENGGPIHGTKAKGGRLGDMMKSHAMAQLGGAAGFFGGGPVGALMGALVGHFGGKILGKGIRYAASSPIKSAILQRISKEDPQIVQKVLQYAKQTPQGLEALKEQLGQKGIGIFNKKSKGSSILTPKPAKQGLLSGIVTKAAVKGVTQ